MTDQPDNVTRLPVVPQRRIVGRHTPAERAQGIAADLRDALDEREVDRDELRGLAVRLEALARDLGSSD